MTAVPGCAARVRAVAPAVLFAVFGWASALAQVQPIWVTNTTPIRIPDRGAADPSPSTIYVSGVSADFGKVTVTLHGLSHTFAPDVDILLVGPGGQAVVLMSEAGGNFGMTNVALVFDDEADGVPPSLPDQSPITSGTFKPTNLHGTNDYFGPTAPSGPYADALSVFKGTNPNGLWSLYVFDNEEEDSGVMAGGWSLGFGSGNQFLDPDALDKWHVRHSLTGSLLGVVSSPNGFVAVGDPGTILVSAEGCEWAPQDSGVNVSILDIAFGGETLVAVGNGAPILTSQDGSNWVKRGTNLPLYDVAFGDGRFVAVGEEGTVQASLDAGVNWQAGSSKTNRPLNGVAYGHGQFVAVGGSGVILVSTNGLDWMPPRSATNVTLYSVAYGAGTFVAVGDNRTILTSPDGMNWTRQTVPPGNGSLFLDVIYANGTFVCGGVTGTLLSNGTLLSSINGVDWTTRTFPPGSHIQGLAFDGETFVAACFGNTNVIFQSDPVHPRPPRILRPPRDTVVRLGSTTSLTVTAAGTSPFMYRWRRNGVPLPGATNQVLTFSNTQVSADGSYSVTVENALGTITSTSALLSVGVPPSIVLQPLDQEVVPGGLAIFSIEVNGTAPCSYRWRQPGTIYTTFPSLGRQSFWTVTNVGAAHAGTYGVLVSNDFGSVLSRGAQLVILTDTDADGLPDRWENEHGLNTNDVADAMLDPDADGMTNLEEYHAGTNPTNAASALRIRTALADGMLSIEFDAESNKTYTVQQNVTLDTDGWNKLIDLAARTNHRIETVTDPSVATNRYYRVVTPRQP